MMNAVLLAAAVLAPVALVNAQAAAYAQCGGIGFSGSTTCISGYTCSVVNDYYSQCLPGSATTTTGGGGGSTTTASVTTTAVASNTANPFSGKKQWANPYYASEVSSIAIPQITDSALKAKASAVAKVPSWTWLDTMAKVPAMQTYLQDMTTAGATGQIAPFVVYDLPERDCSAAASNGELSLANNGSALYMEYIDSIAAIIKQFPAITVALIIEPDSLANLVTNLNVAKCANAEDAYKTLTVYALKTLALDNVVMYMDGGHSGWLGWPANLPPAATLYASMWSQAGKPAQLRGLATNVANYNGWALASCPSYTQSNTNCDEQKYITAMSAQLASNGWSNTHYIVDQGRSGVQPTAQQAQGDWCNVVGVGFGIRPDTAPTNALLDAFVWVKPGGESDGTSNTSSTRYDYHCGLSDALQPAPEAGTWFQAMFVQLLTNANPSF